MAETARCNSYRDEPAASQCEEEEVESSPPAGVSGQGADSYPT